MKKTTKNNTRIKIIIILLILILGSIITINYITRDNIYVYYRTYTKEKGWSKWVKNGEVCGTDKYAIRAAQVKVKSNKKGDIFYNTYSNNTWMDNDSYSGIISGDKKHKIKKVKMILSDTLYKKYNVKYRLYTNHNITEYAYNYYELFSKADVGIDSNNIEDSELSDIYKIQIVIEEKGDNNEKK